MPRRLLPGCDAGAALHAQRDGVAHERRAEFESLHIESVDPERTQPDAVRVARRCSGRVRGHARHRHTRSLQQRDAPLPSDQRQRRPVHLQLIGLEPEALWISQLQP